MTPTDRPDVVELLARDTPPPLSAATMRRHHALIAQAIADDPVPRASRHTRRRVVVGVWLAGALAASGAAAAASWVTSRAPAEVWGVRCYATADVGSLDDETTFSTASDVDLDTSAGQALDICRASWQDELLSPRPPYLLAVDPKKIGTPNHPGKGTVPASLVACVLPNGIVGVFPIATCSELGLPASAA